MTQDIQAYLIVLAGLASSMYHAERMGLGVIGWSLLCSIHFLLITLLLQGAIG